MIDLRKNVHEVIRIQPSAFRGHDLVDVRVWVGGDMPGGKLIPTKKGVAFQPAQLPEVIDALQNIADAERSAEAVPE